MAFTPNENTEGVLYLRVTPRISGRTGTFSLICTSKEFRPLALPSSISPIDINEWVSGVFPNHAEENFWYSTNVEAGTTYYVWWNCNLSTGNPVDIHGWYENTWANTQSNSSFTSYYPSGYSFTPSESQAGKIYFRARKDRFSGTGSYSFIISTSSTMPSEP